MLSLLGQEVGEDAEDHCRIQELQDPDGQVKEAKNDTSDSHRVVMSCRSGEVSSGRSKGCFLYQTLVWITRQDKRVGGAKECRLGRRGVI